MRLQFQDRPEMGQPPGTSPRERDASACSAVGQPQVSRKPVTYADYAALDDGKRYQVFSGMLVAEPAPTTFHQQVVMNLSYLLRSHTSQSAVGGVLLASPVDVILDPTEQIEVLQPDIVWVSRARMEIVKKAAIFGAPDLVVEVLSPSNARRDRQEKVLRYRRFGVPHIWVLDPEDRTFEETVRVGEAYGVVGLYRDVDIVRPRCFPQLALPLSEVWQPYT
ncbi:MAG: Uma2 family endonuclease [Bacillota bacterium]